MSYLFYEKLAELYLQIPGFGLKCATFLFERLLLKRFRYPLYSTVAGSTEK